ncbi:flagellar hook assembly protein FlgD [Peribacillus asahii]|uniref:flagellar hook assembly protein FlgD n=1 Tax=Peribacillus asahii TaxID=228899 RepID=UPI00207A9576|nr:flagellar hook assembly protein FlgD [Peribacillus asahii]USK61214.1 flagellar hook assembly protein FlgD [Peribacillus asahii]
MMTTIDTSLLLSNNVQERKVGDALGKDDFLKLFITQLQNQDPSSPMDNGEFIAQMATFSTMEQMINIGSKIDTLIQNNKQNDLLNYSTFVGKEIKWHSIEESGDSEEAIIKEGTGVIQSVKYKGDNVYFLLEDGTKLEPGNISEVHSIPSNSLVTGSELIGKQVTWQDEDGNELSGLIRSVLMSNNKLLYEIDDEKGTKLTSDQLIKIASK